MLTKLFFQCFDSPFQFFVLQCFLGVLDDALGRSDADGFFLAVKQPYFDGKAAKKLQIFFSLLNDGKKALDPRLKTWVLIVNGKAIVNSQAIFGNGPKDARWKKLPSGDRLDFGYALGKYFRKPGVYRVTWKGNGFESAPLVFRVGG